MNGIFYNRIFCFDLNNSITFKEKKSLIDLITNNGGSVSFVLNNKCSYVVKNDQDSIDTYKCRQAFKLSIPVVHVDYIYHSINANNINYKNYLIENKENEKNFKQGKVSKGKKMFYS